MNLRSLGPALALAPDAQCDDDGELEVALVRPEHTASLVTHLRRAALDGGIALRGRPGSARPFRARDPRGNPIFWFAPKPTDGPDAGTDRNAVEAAHVSITPLRLDLTDDAALANIRAGS